MNLINPEAAGISSAAFVQLLDEFERQQLPLHSLLISRGNLLIFEGYYAPYSKEDLHRMFSVGKSLTALAIGHLCDQGLLSLDDPIINYFPEYVPTPVPKELAALTIRHMLSMQTCHSFTTYKKDLSSDWVRSFFQTPPSHMPGTVFCYDTSSTHTLSALIEKISGLSLMEYMQNAFLQQIGFSSDAYFLKDPFGVSMGGSGLMARPRDLLLVGQLLLNLGTWNHQSLISENFIKEATHFQVNTYLQGPIFEEKQGYGYQIWRTQNDGFACYGLGGQYILCYPKKELVIAITADTIGMQGANQLIFNGIYDYLFPNCSDSPQAEDPETILTLQTKIKNLALAPLKNTLAHLERYSIEPIYPKKEYLFCENHSGFQKLHFDWNQEKKEGNLCIMKDDDYLQLPFGFEQLVVSTFPIYHQRCATSALWMDESTLIIKSHIIDESIGSVLFHFHFNEEGFTLFIKKFEESLFQEFQGYFSS